MPRAPTSRRRLAPGYVLQTRTGQRYLIERYLARGATARVYAAIETATHEQVAVRVLHDTSPHAIDRFQSEVIAYGRLSSCHVPRLHATGRSPDGIPYMVLDLLTGATLAKWLERGVLAIPAAVELGIQLMHALHDVHSNAIVHCDVKPANIFIERDEGRFLVRLIDFGICRHVQGAAADAAIDTPSRPVQETVLGTPAYMSPEQISGQSVDLRSDLYSAAAVLYRSLTGRQPFSGSTPAIVMSSALRDPIVPPSVLRQSCPLELERVVMWAMCREARFRYASAHEIGDELDWIARRYSLPRGANAWSTSPSVPPRPSKNDATRRLERPPNPRVPDLPDPDGH